MRIISVVACVAFVTASGVAGIGSALAADCNKGMLWPFVRTAGDCLTDVEVASGKTGVYSGPVDTNVDVSAIKPSETPVQNTTTGSSGGRGLLGGPLIGGSSGGGGNGELITTTSVFGGGPAGPAHTVNCTKGAFWPFTRDPGDCLTEAEKKAGKTGVYGGGPGVQVSAAAAGAQTPASAPAPAPAATCQKGWFWPFVRESNDCPSEADKRSGK